MVYGHGDDTYLFDGNIGLNFSSNCYYGFDCRGLISHLRGRLETLVTGYPHPCGDDLGELIAARHGIAPNRVGVFNGATEAIYLIAQAFGRDKNMIVGPTFSEYESACLMQSAICKKTAWEELINDPSHCHGMATVWICNPNNPDGKVRPRELLESLIVNNPQTVFIVDQSYADFTQEPLLEADNKMKNLIIVNSLTKSFNIPGLRLGYIISSPILLNRVNAQRMPWSVNSMAIEAGKYLMEKHEGSPVELHALLEQRRLLQGEFLATGSIFPIKSDTHYFLSRLSDRYSVKWLKQELAARHGILIRDAGNFGISCHNHFRVAARGSHDNEQLIKAIKEILNA